ncbi:hypothetical protein ACVWXM_003131 [Bradyrhizobium sp. GM7.3]
MPAQLEEVVVPADTFQAQMRIPIDVAQDSEMISPTIPI